MALALIFCDRWTYDPVKRTHIICIDMGEGGMEGGSQQEYSTWSSCQLRELWKKKTETEYNIKKSTPGWWGDNMPQKAQFSCNWSATGFNNEGHWNTVSQPVLHIQWMMGSEGSHVKEEYTQIWKQFSRFITRTERSQRGQPVWWYQPWIWKGRLGKTVDLAKHPNAQGRKGNVEGCVSRGKIEKVRKLRLLVI